MNLLPELCTKTTLHRKVGGCSIKYSFTIQHYVKWGPLALFYWTTKREF